jgi:hypothetical protein
MLDALADPEHPDHAEAAEYLEGWDLKEINELPLKIALGRIADRRSAARTRIARKRADHGALTTARWPPECQSWPFAGCIPRAPSWTRRSGVY